MTIPDVSVIIPPCFNAVDYVGESIRSVLDQSIAEDRAELIVVDDGSTDGSGEVISRLASQEPRMTVITQANSGTAGGARNPGIDAARGEFVFFLDADDLLTPEALERMVDVALAEESDVVLGRLAGMDGRKVPLEHVPQDGAGRGPGGGPGVQHPRPDEADPPQSDRARGGAALPPRT